MRSSAPLDESDNASSKKNSEDNKLDDKKQQVRPSCRLDPEKIDDGDEGRSVTTQVIGERSGTTELIATAAAT